AAQMASSLSDPLTLRMQTMAGNAQFCPHGEPIRALDGTLALTDDHLLATAQERVLVEVSRILTGEPARLGHAAALQLTPGAELTVIHIAPFSGPMQLKVGGEYRIIGHNLAELIRVKTI